MGFLRNEGGVEEVKEVLKNAEEEIPPLDVKDYEELGLIIEPEELGENSNENIGSVDFNAMFSDFFPEEEEMALEMNFHPDIDEKEIFDPPVVLPIIEPSFMKFENCMEIDPPEEIKLGGAQPSLSADSENWDYELMKWIWYPNSYEEFLRFYKG